MLSLFKQKFFNRSFQKINFTLPKIKFWLSLGYCSSISMLFVLSLRAKCNATTSYYYEINLY